jgi:hypothetical protein
VTLSFLYWAFCRVLQLIRLIGRRNVDFAVEVIMLRHEVAVLHERLHLAPLGGTPTAVVAGALSYGATCRCGSPTKADPSGGSGLGSSPVGAPPGRRKRFPTAVGSTMSTVQ